MTTADLPGFDPIDNPPRDQRATTSAPSSTDATTLPHPGPTGPQSTDTPGPTSSQASSTPQRRRRPWSRTPTPAGSSPASTPNPALQRQLAEGYAGLAATGLGVVGLVLNAKTAPGTELWIPRPLDVKEICEPIGRIAARHAPMNPGVATDLSDAAGAVVGVAGYAQHNLTQIAQLQAGHAPAAQAQPEPVPDYRQQGPLVHPDPDELAAQVAAAPDDGPWNPSGAEPGTGFHEIFPPPPATGP